MKWVIDFLCHLAKQAYHLWVSAPSRGYPTRMNLVACRITNRQGQICIAGSRASPSEFRSIVKVKILPLTSRLGIGYSFSYFGHLWLCFLGDCMTSRQFLYAGIMRFHYFNEIFSRLKRHQR